jgi:hypothetical protein
MLHLTQLTHPSEGRRAAIVDGNRLLLLCRHRTLYSCASAAIAQGRTFEAEASADPQDGELDYDEVYDGQSLWRLLPAFDHPDDPFHCLVSGTGLTHRKSAANRDAMHQAGEPGATISDSMRIYQWGAEGGRPAPGAIGVQPEWFYKGSGSVLRAHGEPLETPDFADDGGEEPEIAGVYLIDPDGAPVRVGFTPANEFSDHVMERKNYLYLAPSKLRTCAIGPELVVGGTFDRFEGRVAAKRDGAPTWSHEIGTGEANMVHSLANLEHHHFKYPGHRVPGSVHIHFFGADAFSFGDGITLRDGDTMEVEWQGLGRPLRNTVRVAPGAARLWEARPL